MCRYKQQQAPDKSPTTDQEFVPSDRWTAHYLRTNYGEDIRYNHSNKKWHTWDGTKWNSDSMDEIRQYAEKNVNKMWDRHREMPHSDIELNKERTNFRKWIVKSESVRGIKDALEYAQSLKGIAVTEADFDKNPNLFNCLNGTLDLESDTFYEHKKADNLSKISGTTYIPDAECPFWLECLDLWFDGDAELIRFVQVAVGYTLCGTTDEELFYFAHGAGKNGKSRFTDALQMLFSDYFSMSDVGLVTMNKYQSADNYDLPHIEGKRLVAVTELDKKHVFNCSLLKKITGGDEISARFIYRDKFEFTPALTLWLFGNHQPRVDDSSEGFWRRMRKIPFAIEIPDNKRMTQSAMKKLFKTELSGVLNWALDGLRDYHENGMIIPKSVANATEEYRSDSDPVGIFKQECIVADKGLKTSVKAVYEKYKAWCLECNEYIISRKELSKSLQGHGFEPAKVGTGGQYFWKNISINENT